VEASNQPSPEGFSQTLVTQRRGARWSTADAYPKPALRRPTRGFKPLIDPRYLSDDAGEDRAALMEGLRITARIAESPGMRDVLGGIARPAGARELIGEKASDLIRSSSS
jgi:choline dehydrogenase-like flavoprotein